MSFVGQKIGEDVSRCISKGSAAVDGRAETEHWMLALINQVSVVCWKLTENQLTDGSTQ